MPTEGVQLLALEKKKRVVVCPVGGSSKVLVAGKNTDENQD